MLPLASLGGDVMASLGGAWLEPRIARVLQGFKSTLTDVSDEEFDELSMRLIVERPEALIKKIPPDDILTQTEVGQFERECAMPVSDAKCGSSRLVIVLKATRLCNLRCVYCNAWAEGPDQTMTFPVLVRAVRRLLAPADIRHVEFVWHGGEIGMLKPKFFAKLIWLQEQFARPGLRITNSLQTNATRLSDEWVEFMKFNRLGIGVSIDGPPEIQDRRRPTADGEPSSRQVAAGIAKLNAAGIQSYGALVVIDRETAGVDPEALLDYFVSIGLVGVNFLNYVPSNETLEAGAPDPQYMGYREFCAWSVNVYKVYREIFRSRIKVRMFEDLITAIHGQTHPRNCYFAGNCIEWVYTLEPNGDLSPCDKFIGTQGSVYGNIMGAELGEILSRSQFHRQTKIAATAEASASVECKWFSVCRGACPHDRRASVVLDPEFRGECCGLSSLLDLIASEEEAVDTAKTAAVATALSCA